LGSSRERLDNLFPVLRQEYGKEKLVKADTILRTKVNELYKKFRNYHILNGMSDQDYNSLLYSVVASGESAYKNITERKLYNMAVGRRNGKTLYEDGFDNIFKQIIGLNAGEINEKIYYRF
jgi:hypothetical protein